jgi:hypothetical protein
MKIKLAIGICALITLSVRGQEVEDVFARNLKEFPWTSDEFVDLERIAGLRQIPLSILRIPKDSLKGNHTIWYFKDSLAINHYDAQLKRETILAKCRYSFKWNKGLLFIQFNKAKTVTYRFTFVSTGSFILLIRKKGKKVGEV